MFCFLYICVQSYSMVTRAFLRHGFDYTKNDLPDVSKQFMSENSDSYLLTDLCEYPWNKLP